MRPHLTLSIWVLLIVLLELCTAQQQQQTKFANVVTQELQQASDASWSSLTNLVGNSALYATASVASGGYSQAIKASDFRFSVPVTATITGIQVTWSKSSNSRNTMDARVRLMKLGEIVNSTDVCPGKCTEWSSAGPSTFRSDRYGDSAFLWSNTWTPADINNAGFGASLTATRTAQPSRDAYVQSVQVTVFFTVPTTTGVPPAPTVPATTEPQQATVPPTQATNSPATTPTEQQQPTRATAPATTPTEQQQPTETQQQQTQPQNPTQPLPPTQQTIDETSEPILAPKDSSEDHTALIIGVSVGGGVGLIIIVVVAAVLLVRYRRAKGDEEWKTPMEKDSKKSYNTMSISNNPMKPDVSNYKNKDDFF